MDLGSVVTKSNPDFLSNPNLPMDRSFYVGLFEFLHSSFKQQISDPDRLDFSYDFYNSYDNEFVIVDSISSVNL